MKFELIGFGRRLKTMLHVDFRRMFTQPLLHIIASSCLVIPMLTSLDSTMKNVIACGAQPLVERLRNCRHCVLSADSL